MNELYWKWLQHLINFGLHSVNVVGFLFLALLNMGCSFFYYLLNYTNGYNVVVVFWCTHSVSTHLILMKFLFDPILLHLSFRIFLWIHLFAGSNVFMIYLVKSFYEDFNKNDYFILGLKIKVTIPSINIAVTHEALRF